METSGSSTEVTARVAAAVGLMGLLTAALLIIFFVVGGPFGTINDLGNAALGCLSAVLAWRHLDRADTSPFGPVAATLGAVVMVVGSILIITDSTGYVLSGLVSSLGAAFIGFWLLEINRRARRTGSLPNASTLLGITAGAVMLLGLLSVPGLLSRLDTDVSPPWHVTAAGVSWLGTYLLYPIWSLRIARHLRDRSGRSR